MLDLQPRVHLHEIEARPSPRSSEEFDRAGASVAHGSRSATAASPIFSLSVVVDMPGEGLSSISFWCCRCTEQSRSLR